MLQLVYLMVPFFNIFLVKQIKQMNRISGVI
ncbi:MAG: hypothetical protein ACI95T_001576 [Flavobacteriales bacterium]